MRGQRRILLTAAQEAAVRLAWKQGLRRDEIARLTGVSIDTLSARLKDQLSDLKRRGRGRGGGHRPAGRDPTEDEIWGRLTLEIQARWTDEQREQAARGAFKRPERTE
jgi:hypothetical protein